MMFDVGFPYVVFIILNCRVSLYSQVCFSEVVNNFKFSFASHELVMWSLPFMNVLDYIKYFRFAEPSLHLLDEINFIMVDNHFYVFLNTVLSILLAILHLQTTKIVPIISL